MFKKILTVLGLIAIGLFIFLESYRAPLPENYGKLDIAVFTGDSIYQPLMVGFGGGEGGNAWASDYWQPTRQQFIDKGYAFMAIEYFGGKNTSGQLDRISLEAIYDSIKSIAISNPRINAKKIMLIGASKGAELALNLASRYSDINGVVAIVPSNVTFPAITIMANTSSWRFKNEEVPFVPATYSTILPAIKGDLLEAHRLMLEDSTAVKNAEIAIEEINGPILFISATKDEQWPSTEMTELMMKRLRAHDFRYYSEHIAVEGGHAAPLKHFNKVFDFLETHFR